MFLNNLIPKNSYLQLSEIKNLINDESSMPLLQYRLDESEKNGDSPFSDFNDMEMLQYFLHKRENLNEDLEKSKRTKKEYERELSMFIVHLHKHGQEIGLDITRSTDNSLFKSLDKRHIRRYQEWLADKSPRVIEKGPYSPATLARKTVVLKSFLSFLFTSKYISEPIHEGLYKASVRKDDRPNRDLGAIEVRQLLDHFRLNGNLAAFAITYTLVTTGIRNEELCKLQKKDFQYSVDDDIYYLNILGKGNKRRQVPLLPKVYKAIEEFRSARGLLPLPKANKEDYIFTTNTHKKYTPSYLSQYLTKQIADTRLPFTLHRENMIGPHTLRHAHAIISYKSNPDLVNLQRSLGHENYNTTLIYLEKEFARKQHSVFSWDSSIMGEYV